MPCLTDKQTCAGHCGNSGILRVPWHLIGYSRCFESRLRRSGRDTRNSLGNSQNRTRHPPPATSDPAEAGFQTALWSRNPASGTCNLGPVTCAPTPGSCNPTSRTSLYLASRPQVQRLQTLRAAGSAREEERQGQSIHPATGRQSARGDEGVCGRNLRESGPVPALARG